MQFYSSRKYNFLKVSTFCDKVFYCVRMGYRSNILLNNWSGIQFFSYVVTSGTDNFHTSFKCCMIGFSTGKGR